MTITLTSKNQITIPKKIVNELHLKEGAIFDIRISEHCLELTPMEMIEKPFTDAEYAKLDELCRREKHTAKPLTPALIDKLLSGKK